MHLYAAGSKLRTDLSWGPFEAVFEIPPRADSRRVTASYKHGLLKVGLSTSLAWAVHLLWPQTLSQPALLCAGAHLQDMIHIIGSAVTCGCPAVVNTPTICTSVTSLHHCVHKVSL